MDAFEKWWNSSEGGFSAEHERPAREAFRAGLRDAAEIAMSARFGLWSCDTDDATIKVRELVRDAILAEADK